MAWALLWVILAAIQTLTYGLAISRASGEASFNGVSTGQLVLSPRWDVNAGPTIREFDWTISETTASPGGLPKRLLVVNGQSPGPLIEANLGDTVEVTVTNHLQEITAIHWHGQPQNGTNHMDGSLGITDCGISPGTSFTYRWTVQTYGTYWWHAHAGFQHMEGLRGPLILHSPDDPYRFGPTYTSVKDRMQNKTYDADQILIASDLYNNPAQSYMKTYMSPIGFGNEMGVEPVPDCGTINGHGVCAEALHSTPRSNLTVLPGGRYRFRLLNVGALGSIRFSLQGHSMTVIEIDGTLVEPVDVQFVDVDVAQRCSVLIEMNQPADAYKFHAELLKDMFGMRKDSLITDQYAVLRYDGVPLSEMPSAVAQPPSLNKHLIGLDNDLLHPLQAIAAPPSTEQETLTIHFGLTAQSVFRSFINGSSWENEGYERRASLYDMFESQRAGNAYVPEEFMITKEADKTVLDLIINNLDEGDHTLHLHGYTPFVLGHGVGFYQHTPHPQWGETLDLTQNFTNPMRRDVFIVPAYGWVIVRIVLDNPGIWALHCHVAWHQAIGFMAQLNVKPAATLQQGIPKANMAQCKY